ncbi:unnamed protein product [Closterium sp. Yama58-4]|nr:unnamed protein product [Closterium sp. Yama58-4]
MAYPTVASHQPPEYLDSTVPFPDFPGRQSLSPELDRQISELISAMEAAREASDRVQQLFCRSLYPCIKRELGSLREEGHPGGAKDGGENCGEGGGKRAGTQGEELGRGERSEGDGENKSKSVSLILVDNSAGTRKRVTSGGRPKVRRILTVAEDKAVEEAEEEEDGGEEGREQEKKEEEGCVDTRQGLGSKEPTKVGLPNGRGVSASVLPFGAPSGISVPEAAEEKSGGERAVGMLEGARRRDDLAKQGDGAADVPAAVSAFREAEKGSAKEEKCLRGLDQQHDDIDASDTDSEEDHHVPDSQRKGSDGVVEGDSCTPSSATAAAAATIAALERKHGAKGKYKVGEAAVNIEVAGKRSGEMESTGQYRNEVLGIDEAVTRVDASVAVIGALPVVSKGAEAARVVVGHAVGVHAELKGEGGNGFAGMNGAGAEVGAGVAGEDGIGGSACARRSSSTSSSGRSSSGGDGVGNGRVWRGRGDGESSSQKQQGGALKQTCLARHFSGGSRRAVSASKRSFMLTSAAAAGGGNAGGSGDAVGVGRDDKLSSESSAYAGISRRGANSGEKFAWATRSSSAARSTSRSFTHGLGSLPQAKQQPGRKNEEKQLEQPGNENKQYVQEREQEQEQEQQQEKEPDLEVLAQNMLWHGDDMDRQNSLQQQQEEGQKEQQEQGLVQQRQGHQGQVLLDLDGMDEEGGARSALGAVDAVGAAGVQQSSEKKRGADDGAKTAGVPDADIIVVGATWSSALTPDRRDSSRSGREAAGRGEDVAMAVC